MTMGISVQPAITPWAPRPSTVWVTRLASARPVLDCILYHHERFDGSGYPERLRGEAIPYAARLLGVADAFDALTSARAYRRSLEPGEAGLDFAGRFGGGRGGLVLDLSPNGDLAQAAANLYACLRRLDASGAPSIAVAPIPAMGLGEAIADRLRRAAAPRETERP